MTHICEGSFVWPLFQDFVRLIFFVKFTNICWKMCQMKTPSLRHQSCNQMTVAWVPLKASYGIINFVVCFVQDNHKTILWSYNWDTTENSHQTHFHSTFPFWTVSMPGKISPWGVGVVGKVKTVLVNVSLEPVFFLFCVNLGLVMIPNADLYLSKVHSSTNL